MNAQNVQQGSRDGPTAVQVNGLRADIESESQPGQAEGMNLRHKQTKAPAKTQKVGVSVVTTWINGRSGEYWMQSWCLNSVAAAMIRPGRTGDTGRGGTHHKRKRREDI